MWDSGFVVTYPLYVIVVRNERLSALSVVSEDEGEDELRAIALFSEQLLAERTRDEQSPSAMIWQISNEEDLRTNHLPRFRQWGYEYVAIDTHERTGKGWYIPIEDLEA